MSPRPAWLAPRGRRRYGRSELEFRILGALEVVDGERVLALGGVKGARCWPSCCSTRTRRSRSSTDRRGVGRGGARHGGQEHPRVRVAAAQGAVAGPARPPPARPIPCGRTRSISRASSGCGRSAARGARAVARAAVRRPGLRAVRASRAGAAGGAAARRAATDRRGHGRRPPRHLAGELEALIAREPLRERFRGQLMLALYRCARRSRSSARRDSNWRGSSTWSRARAAHAGARDPRAGPGARPAGRAARRLDPGRTGGRGAAGVRRGAARPADPIASSRPSRSARRRANSPRARRRVLVAGARRRRRSKLQR